MKILIAVPYFYPRVGGLEAYARAQAQGLKSRGWQVVVVCGDPSVSTVTRATMDGYTVYRLPVWKVVSNTPIHPAWPGQLRRIIRDEKPDVVNAHAPVPSMALAAAVAAGKTPFVLTYHAGSMKKGRLVPDVLIAAYEKLFLPLMLRKAKRIICASEFVREQFLHRYQAKSATVTPGVDVKKFVPNPAIQVPGRVVFIGDFRDPRKGLGNLLEAVRPLEPVSLRVIGQGAGTHQPGVEYLGVLKGQALVREIQAAQVLVLPSTTEAESFGMVLVEAMACGIPVIGSDVGGVSTVIEPGQNGLLVPPNNVSALRQAIKKILNSPELAQRLGNQGRVMAEQRYTWDSRAEATDQQLRLAVRPRVLLMSSGTPHSSLTHRSVAFGHQLVERGYDVSMIAPSMDRHSDWKLDAPAEMDGVKMIYPMQLRTKSTAINLLPYLPSAALQVLKHKADLVHIFKPTPASALGLLAKLAYRTPVILDMDDLGSEVMQGEGRAGLMYKLVQTSEHWAAKYADAFVGASRLLESEFTSRYPDKPALRLPNGVDPELFVLARPARGPVKIVFFGVLGTTKILGPVIEALPEVARRVGKTNVKLEVLGDGPELGALQALARKMGVSSNVTFRGWTKYQQIYKYVSAGDIALCFTPNTRTTAAASNQKVFQYMSAGLCPVVSDVGDLPLYVDHGRAGVIVPSGDVAALADAMVDLIQHEAKRKQIAERARTLAETKFSWQVLGSQLEQLMRGVQ